MTLALELGGIQDQYVRRALELLAQQFPLAASAAMFQQAPGAIVSATSAQSVTSNTTVKAALDTTVKSNGVTVDLTNDRITVLTAGKYYVFGQAGFTKDLSTRIMATRAHIRKNSVEHQDFPAQTVHSPNGAGNTMEMSVSALVDLAVNDTLELWVFQVNDGAAAENLVGVAADSSRTKLGCVWLNP